MKNRLQKIFSHDKPEKYTGHIKLNGSEFIKKFYVKLEELQQTGSSQKIDGVDRIELDQTINGKNYPLHSNGNVSNVHILTQHEPYEIKVQTEYGEYKWVFDKMELKEKIILRNQENSVFVMNLEFMANSTLSYSGKANPQYANSVSEIIETYSAVLALFAMTFEEEPTELSTLRNELKFWQRTYEVEQLLNAEFKPGLLDLQTFHEDMKKFDELYLLLVKKIFLRENKHISSFTINSLSEIGNPPELNINDKYALQFISNIELNILGQEICIYSVCVAFNHIIDSVDKNDETGEIVLYTREDESSPRYISLRGFGSEQEQKEEHLRLSENFSENVKEYFDAGTLISNTVMRSE